MYANEGSAVPVWWGSTIEFLWPPKELKPNSRCHWGAKNRAAQKYKHDCYITALGTRPPKTEEIELMVTFHPKTKNKIDMDNAIASAKYLFDGLAMAWGVDDSRFKLIPRIAEPFKHGKVVITLPQDTKQASKGEVPCAQ